MSMRVHHPRSLDELDTAGAEGYFTQMRATLNGPVRAWLIYAWVMGLAFTGLLIWSAIRYFQTQDIRESITYATVFLICGMMVSLVKIWYYVQAAQHTHSREIRRLERMIRENVRGAEKSTADRASA